MTSLFRYSVLAVCVGLLSACGGSGPLLEPDFEERETSEQQTAPESQTPSEQADPEDPFEVFGTETPDEVETEESVLEENLAEAETDIVLTGVAIVRDATTGERIIVRRDGTYVAADGSRTLAGLALTLTNDVPGAFDDTSSFVQSDAVGVVGVATDLANMPADGDATFTGGAVGFVITGDAGTNLVNGNSTVTVDFAAGTIDATLDGFTPVSQVSEKLVTAPFETLVLESAAISGNGFSGGTLTSTGGTSVANITGDNARLLSEGQFFGADAGAPAEVGGLIYTEGDSGKIFSSFIAD